jgi:hypothetical protein
MSLIKNKFIGAGEIVQDAISDGITLKAPSQNAVFDALALKVSTSQLGIAGGVATLDGSGKIPSAQLTVEAMEYKGAWNATTNTPTLIDGTGNNGDFYRVSVAGTQDLGSGSHTYAVADSVIYNGTIWQFIPNASPVSSVNGFTGVVVLTTTDIAEGTNLYYTNTRFDTRFGTKTTTDLAEGSNLYFTDARARTAVISATITNGDTTHSPSGDAVFDALALKQDIATALKPKKENFTLAGADITNQYVDMTQVITADSLHLVVDGVYQIEGEDYTISLTGGAGGKTRLTFAGDLATGGPAALIAGDKLHVQYMYA